MGITAVVVSGLKCILPTTTRVDHPPTSQLIEERILLQLLAKRKVQALRAQGVVSLEVRLANREPQSRSGREQSIVTETEAPRGSRLLLTDKHVRDEEWSREYQCAVCGATRSGSQFLYISHRAAWVSSNGPMLALHTAWHMKAMVGLFHVAKEDSGARMIKRQETKFWSSSGEPSSGGKLKALPTVRQRLSMEQRWCQLWIRCTNGGE